MKKAVSLIAASAMFAAPAFAGTIEPTPAEPVIAPAVEPVAVGPDWTGFYGGAQLGYGDVDTNVAGADGDGLVGGVTIGYDYDFGDVVLGGGLDYDMTDISLAPGTDVDSIWRAKVRGGLKVGNGLPYITAGYAQADVNTLGSDDGYFVGAGYEHMVSDQFSVGGEVLYHEFDNYNNTLVDVEATTVQVRGTFRF